MLWGELKRAKRNPLVKERVPNVLWGKRTWVKEHAAKQPGEKQPGADKPGAKETLDEGIMGQGPYRTKGQGAQEHRTKGFEEHEAKETWGKAAWGKEDHSHSASELKGACNNSQVHSLAYLVIIEWQV
jgi:hypothetical protein